MPKDRTGLHKKISSIFDGVPIPRNDTEQKPHIYSQPPSQIKKSDDDILSKPTSIDDFVEPVVELVEKPVEDVVQKPKVATPGQLEQKVTLEPKPLQPETEIAEISEPTKKKIETIKQKIKIDSVKQLFARIDWRKIWQTVISLTLVLIEKVKHIQWRKNAEFVADKTVQLSHSLKPITEKLTRKIQKLTSKVEDPRQKKMLILMPILVVVFIIVLIRTFGSASPQAALSENSAAVDTAGTASASKINWEIPNPYPEAIRDPMKQGSESAGYAVGGQFIVKGIVHSKDQAAAIVGTQIVHEGDKISDATVVKILEDGVVFELNGKTWGQKVQK